MYVSDCGQRRSRTQPSDRHWRLLKSKDPSLLRGVVRIGMFVTNVPAAQGRPFPKCQRPFPQCGDSVFCCSGTASGDPCHFILFHRIISVGTASGNLFSHIFHSNSSHHFYLGTPCGDSVFCSVIDLHICSDRAPPVATLLHISVDFIASFLWPPPVATQFSVLS